MKNSTKTLLALLILNFGIFTILIAQNNCLDFDGTNEYVATTSAINLSGLGNDLTLESWIYVESFQSASPYISSIIGIEDNLTGTALIRLGDAELANNKVQFVLSFDNGGTLVQFKLNGTTELSINTWYHVAATFDLTTLYMKIYINGVQEPNTIYGGYENDFTANGNFYIGAIFSPATRFLDGKIDEVRVWSTTRTQAEIRANMYKELAGTETGLVAYYKFNETTGTTADNAEGTAAYDGTLNNMTNDDWVNSGAFAGPGNCLLFDGVDEYIDIGTGPTTVQTVEFWLYPTTTTEYFVDLNGSAYISSGSGTISATGFISPTIYVDGIESTTIESGTWQHIAVTTGTSINTSDLDIGRLEGQEEFDGKIDEVRLWSDVRTATEIRDNMCRTLAGDETGLIAYYRFDQEPASGGSLTLFDITSNSNHGTLTNMEATADWVDCKAFDTWIGFHSSDWATPGNWSNGVPSASDNVGIPKWLLGHSPTLSGSPTVNNIVIGLLATLNLSSDFTINRHYIKLGTLSPGTNTVTFGGSSKQYLVGINLGFYNLTINNTHASNKVSAWWCTSLSVSNNLTITDGIFYSKSDYKNVSIGTNGTLELSGNITVSGNWDNDGTFTHNNHTVTLDGSSTQTIQGGNTTTFHNLTINSGAVVNINPETDVTVNGTLTNSAGTSGLVIKSDATGTGSLIHNTAGVNAKVEQYLTSERWHLVSPPISNATINVYFDIYLKEWNEPDSTWTYLVNPTTSPMNVTRGYAAWASDVYTGTTTVSYPGTLNTGDKSPAISYTTTATHAGKGWNLIGNPYPCALDWNINWSITDLSGWAVVYDNGIYRGWHTDGTSYNGKPNGIIPSTQGFWIRALNTSASLIIPASERVHNSQIFYKEGQETIYPEVRIEAESNGYTDETVVIFHPECTAGFDGYYDLSKFWNVNEAPQLYSITEEDNYAINFLPENYHEVVIPIGFKTGQPGIFIITATSVANFIEDINIYLEDINTGDFVKLYKNTQYEFGYNPEENDHRFNLHFTEINYGIEDNIQSVFNIYSCNDVVYIQNPENIRGDIYIYNLMGQEVANAPVNSALNKITLNKSGNYIVKVLSGKSVVTRKVFIK